MEQPICLLISAMGIFTICGAAFDWNWFMNSRRARLFVSIFGRTGARIFYAILGAVITVLGVLLAFGIIKN